MLQVNHKPWYTDWAIHASTVHLYPLFSMIISLLRSHGYSCLDHCFVLIDLMSAEASGEYQGSASVSSSYRPYEPHNQAFDSTNMHGHTHAQFVTVANPLHFGTTARGGCVQSTEDFKWPTVG